MPFSAKGLISDSKVNLEKVALDKFGGAVEDFTKSLGKKTGSNTSTSNPSGQRQLDYRATSYAAGLAGTDFRPKMKFMFKVQFVFTDEYQQYFKKTGAYGATNDFTFSIKSVDRPKVDFEYEEDVNMYNFRTKALKRIRYRELSMIFMDDSGNRVFDFFRLMLTLHSPVSRISYERDGTLDLPDVGMKRNNFTAGHRGVFNGMPGGNPIKTIRVQQIFTDPQSPAINAAQMVSFDFVNPRITSFDYDELSHEANDASLLTMVFDFDWLEMVKVGPLGTNTAPYPQSARYNFAGIGINNAPLDINPLMATGAPKADKVRPSSSSYSSYSSAKKDSTADDPFTKAMKGTFGRAATQYTSDKIGKLVKGAVGDNRFGKAVAGTLSNAVTGLSTQGVNAVLNSETAKNLQEGATNYATAAWDSTKSAFSRMRQTKSTDGS